MIRSWRKKIFRSDALITKLNFFKVEIVITNLFNKMSLSAVLIREIRVSFT